jgi:hypothetical protein
MGSPPQLRTPAQTTRVAWHTIAEHIVAAARHRATGRIGLRPMPDGFGSPWFPATGEDGGDEKRIRVEGAELVVEERTDDGPHFTRRQPITTLRAAGAFVGIEPGAPDVYQAVTPLDLDAELSVDDAAADELARFLAVVDAALHTLRTDIDGGRATPDHAITLWPEHFDLATSIDEVNYGGSPADDDHPEPYLYVGPWTPPAPDGEFWNEAFGASVPDAAAVSVDAALAFFREGRRRVADLDR